MSWTGFWRNRDAVGVNVGNNSEFLPWQQPVWQRVLRQRAGSRLAHSYLLAGPRGIGKVAFARAVAALRLCREPEQDMPCGRCKACRLWQSGSHPDFLMVTPEREGGQLRIEQVREVGDFVQSTAAYAGSARVVVLAPAEALGTGAANALLKSLEEPPGDSLFLLVSHLPGAVLATLRSRCQPLLMPTPDANESLSWLASQLGAADASEAAALAPDRPLLALEMWHAGVPALHAELKQAAGRLAEPGVDVPALARDLGKHNPVHVVQFVESSVASCVRRLVCEQPAESRDWLDFYQWLIEIRRQLTGSGNPNVQLTLETLLFRWSEMLNTCR